MTLCCFDVVKVGSEVSTSISLGKDVQASTIAMHLPQLPCVAVELIVCKLNQTNET